MNKPKSQWKSLVLSLVIIFAIFGGAWYYTQGRISNYTITERFVEIPEIITTIYAQNGDSVILTLSLHVNVYDNDISVSDLIPLIDETVRGLDLQNVTGSGNIVYIQNSLNNILSIQGDFEINGVYISNIMTLPN